MTPSDLTQLADAVRLMVQTGTAVQNGLHEIAKDLAGSEDAAPFTFPTPVGNIVAIAGTLYSGTGEVLDVTENKVRVRCADGKIRRYDAADLAAGKVKPMVLPDIRDVNIGQSLKVNGTLYVGDGVLLSYNGDVVRVRCADGKIRRYSGADIDKLSVV